LRLTASKEMGALKMLSYPLWETKTLANDLKQLAFLGAEHFKRFSPKKLKIVHKGLFTISSISNPIESMEGLGFSKKTGTIYALFVSSV